LTNYFRVMRININMVNFDVSQILSIFVGHFKGFRSYIQSQAMSKKNTGNQIKDFSLNPSHFHLPFPTIFLFILILQIPHVQKYSHPFFPKKKKEKNLYLS
jgi:hypothetical protein